MLGCSVLFRNATAMNWIYWVEKEGIQLWKNSLINKPTCYITLYSTLTLFYRLVSGARAATYTMNNILSAFDATGIWPHKPNEGFLWQSQNITPFESPSATPTPLLSATHSQPRAGSRLARSALHLVTRQSPSRPKLMALVAQLARSAWVNFQIRN